MAISRYSLYTLVDISKTDVTQHTPEWITERNQQRNLDTVLQLISLKTQPIDIKYFKPVLEHLSNYTFGVDYQGEHRVWRIDWSTEYDHVYAKGPDRYGILKEYCTQSPIILNLNETARPSIPLLYPSGPSKNIYFIQIA